MGMSRVESTEGGKELACFDLQAIGQAGRLQKRFFELDIRLVEVIELKDNVSEPFEIGINGPIERDFGVAPVKSALLRIVIAHFDLVEITGAGCSEREHRVERNVHVILVSAAGELNRLSER